MGSLVGVGYEGLAPGELVALLVERGVTTLVDVRLNAVSRKPGFSKNALRAAVEAAGIAYVHARALGNPKENRPLFQSGDLAEGHARYRAHLATPDAADALAELRERANNETVALLCLEREPERCHRTVLLDVLAAGA